MATRESLLDATAQLFAEHGWRGTTTRKIAEVAGVNEVTLFRQFGSKDSLIAEAIGSAGYLDGPGLPDTPVSLASELTVWCIVHQARLREKSGIIRACLADWGERPELAPRACAGGAMAAAELRRYFGAARDAGLIGAEASIDSAALMLINTVFMDAMTRDAMPSAYAYPVEQSIAMCVNLLLRGLGAKELA